MHAGCASDGVVRRRASDVGEGKVHRPRCPMLLLRIDVDTLKRASLLELLRSLKDQPPRSADCLRF